MNATKKTMPKELTLDQAMADTFAKNPEVKKHYDEMEPEYKIKAQNIEAAPHKRRAPRGRGD